MAPRIGIEPLPERAITLRHTPEADKQSQPVPCFFDGVSLSTAEAICHSKLTFKSDQRVTAAARPSSHQSNAVLTPAHIPIFQTLGNGIME